MLWSWYSASALAQQSQAQHAGGGGENTASAEWIAAESGAGGYGAAPAKSSSGMSTASTITFAAGMFGEAVGSFFEARASQKAAKSHELSLQHESFMSAQNARAAEREAQSIVQGGQQDIGNVTLQAGIEKGAARAAMAGRGVLLGSGSAADVEASINLSKEVDVMAIKVNTARAAAAARVSGVNARNASLLTQVSARNVRRGARGDLLPYAAGGSAIIGGSGRYLAMQSSSGSRS